MMKATLSTIILFVWFRTIKLDAVCTEAILLQELLQDIADNGKLDCLRVPLPPPIDKTELETDKKKRLEAVWDTDCSFEAEYDWITILIENYRLSSGLVNKDGKSVPNDFPDQADMCEIIRALIAGGKIEGFSLSELDAQVLDYISCPGDESQTQVCAATGGSAAQNYSWYIFLEGASLSIDGKPKWEIVSEDSNSRNPDL